MNGVRIFQLCIIGILVMGLTGCDLPRPASQSDGDISNGDVPVASASDDAGGQGFEPPAQGSATVSLQPAAQQVEVGGTAIVNIQIDNAIDVFGADILISFDADLLQVQDTDPSQDGAQIMPGAFLSPDFVQDNEADNATGDIFYTITQVAPSLPASGSGILATITFQAIGEGSSPLTFTDITLANSDGEEIVATVQGGQITVAPSSGQGQPTATFTFTPSPTATQPTATTEATPITTSPGFATTVPPSPSDGGGIVQVTPATDTPTPTPTITPTSTPLPPETNIPPGATIGFCYRVQLGEKIYDVAEKFDTTPDIINLVNDLYPPYLILAHQSLFIPTELGHGPNVYIAEAGDTLSSIANDCKLPVEVIRRANDLAAGVNIQEGHALIIPIPPFPPPARFEYPLPLGRESCCRQSQPCCNPYR